MKTGSRRVHSGRVLDLDIDTVRFPDGSTGELEMIRHSGASAVVPVLTDAAADPEILLIRQFRHAADGPIWEIPAGRLDPGETPEACAARELTEETGEHAGRPRPAGHLLYHTRLHRRAHPPLRARDLTRGQHHREADEFIETRRIPLSRALEMIRSGEIVDGKTIVALLFFSQFGLPV